MRCVRAGGRACMPSLRGRGVRVRVLGWMGGFFQHRWRLRFFGSDLISDVFCRCAHTHTHTPGKNREELRYCRCSTCVPTQREGCCCCCCCREKRAPGQANEFEGLVRSQRVIESQTHRGAPCHAYHVPTTDTAANSTVATNLPI